MKFRHEYKHRVNALDIMLLQKRLAPVAKHDEHCDETGSYLIKSLYFDNYRNKAAREKFDGVDKREKFRIRYYNDDTSFIRLEKKSKINGLCSKESAPMTAEQVELLLEGDTSFLIESDVPLFHELYAKMKYQLLRPVCIVAYERECFVYGPGNVRITLDMNIRGSYDVKRFLVPDVSMTRLYSNSILEVKWDEYLPQIIKNAVQLKNRNSSAFSKYVAVRF